jgi:hypothetical protein
MGHLRGMREPEYANTPRELVYSEDKLKVWHFKGEGKPTSKTPLLIVYALVNTVWMTDLQADRSMVRNLLEQGEDVYLIDWGYPDAADRWLTLDDYINGYLDRCVDVVRAAPRARCDQPARYLPGRRVFVVLHRAASGQGEEPDHHGHAGGLPHAGQHVVALVRACSMWTGLSIPWAISPPVDELRLPHAETSATESAEVHRAGRHPRQSDRAGELPAHGALDLRFARSGRRSVPPVHQGFLPGQQARQGHAGDRRQAGGSGHGDPAGAEHFSPSRIIWCHRMLRARWASMSAPPTTPSWRSRVATSASMCPAARSARCHRRSING